MVRDCASVVLEPWMKRGGCATNPANPYNKREEVCICEGKLCNDGSIPKPLLSLEFAALLIFKIFV